MGDFFSGSQAPPQTVTSSSISAPPDYVIPFAHIGLQDSLNLSRGTPFESTYFTGDRVSDLTPEHLSGVDMLRNIPGQHQDAQDQYRSTVRGDYLTPESNPALRDYYDAAARAVTDQYSLATQPGIDRDAVLAGAMGNSGYQEYSDAARYGLGENLSNLAASIYAPAYENERSRMMQGLGMYPSFLQGDYQQAQGMLGAGDILRNQEQAEINQQIAEHEARGRFPFAMHDFLTKGIQNIGFGSGGVTNTVGQEPGFFQPSPAANILGTGLGLAGIFGPKGFGMFPRD